MKTSERFIAQLPRRVQIGPPGLSTRTAPAAARRDPRVWRQAELSVGDDHITRRMPLWMIDSSPWTRATVTGRICDATIGHHEHK